MEVTSNTTPKNSPLPSFTQKRKQLGVTAAERKRVCLLCFLFFFLNDTLSPHSTKPTTYKQSQKNRADFSDAILGCN